MTEGAPPEPDAAADHARLIEEAGKKSGLLWISLPGTAQPRGAWHLWHEGAAYVVTGGIEQPLPGLTDADRVTVTVRSKDKGGRLISWIASVTRVQPGSTDWEQVVPLLHAKRLNPPDGEQQPSRWARESAVLRLRPTGEVVEAPATMPEGSLAAPPVPSPATTAPPLPYVLGRRRAARRG